MYFCSFFSKSFINQSSCFCRNESFDLSYNNKQKVVWLAKCQIKVNLATDMFCGKSNSKDYNRPREIKCMCNCGQSDKWHCWLTFEDFSLASSLQWKFLSVIEWINVLPAARGMVYPGAQYDALLSKRVSQYGDMLSAKGCLSSCKITVKNYGVSPR